MTEPWYQSVPLEGMQLSPATTEHGITKFNPFINSPPLTADVDTNRLYPRMNRNSTRGDNSSLTTAAVSTASSSIDSLRSISCDVHQTQLPVDKPRFPLTCLVKLDDTHVVSPSPAPFRCAACRKSYSTLSGLSKHREFHCRALLGAQARPQQAPGFSGDGGRTASAAAAKDQRCPQCDKTYTSASALKMHIRTHTLPCRCRLCGKAFSRPWLLQGHVRTHTGEKPFTCPHCQRAFADRSNLRAHLQTHYDVKQYHCDVCRRTFSRMSLLLKHRYGACAVVTDTGNKKTSTGHAQKSENS